MAARRSDDVLRERLSTDGLHALEDLIEVRQERFLTVEQFEKRMAETDGDIREVRSDMLLAVAELRTELLKWSIVFWAAQAGTVAALITALR
jgi:hypothetical protein